MFLILNNDSDGVSIESVVINLELDDRVIEPVLDVLQRSVVVVDVDGEASWVPVHLVKVDQGWSIDAGVEDICAFKQPSGRIEVKLLKGSLGSLDVGSGESLDLKDLKRAIVVVHSLSSSLSSGGEILVNLELPVGPAGEDLVALISNLSDLSSANFRSVTSSKLRDDQRNTKSLGILISSVDSVVMPVRALLGHVDRWLTRGADGWVELTAVGVIVEHVIGRVVLASWWVWETSPVHDSLIGVWILASLKIHDALRIMLLEHLPYSCIHGSKKLLVEDSRSQNGGVLIESCRERLVNWIVAYDILVACELLANNIPEVDKRVLEAVLVGVEGIEDIERLR